ncbi:MAG: aminomethyl transferase family protein, partial [Deltaproteobacteria bacterium]|nr:aminomethyl transferase family protein [Deltaproteobacteria bacterium]
DDLSGFTKGFIGSMALQHIEKQDYTYGFTGHDVRKVSAGENSEVIDGNGNIIGSVLTCATDMGIGRVDNKIVSITSPDKPQDFFPKGLSCGFVKVDRSFETEDALTLREGKRKIEVEIRNDIRPYRSARIPVREML